jgi:hypothetical protein
MSITPAIPSFDIYLEDLNQFIFELVDAYHARKIESWGDLEAKVNVYFTPERMEHTENLVPGWRKMASYAERVTVVHVMCAFLGLYMMPEFLSMTKEQQQMMKWVILFHDIEKEPQKEKRDHGHAFRSAVAAAKILPGLGFPITSEYERLINPWSEFIRSAIIRSETLQDSIQDYRKLPKSSRESSACLDRTHQLL